MSSFAAMSGELAVTAESASAMDAPAYPDEYKKRRLSGDERLSRKYVSPTVLAFFVVARANRAEH